MRWFQRGGRRCSVSAAVADAAISARRSPGGFQRGCRGSVVPGGAAAAQRARGLWLVAPARVSRLGRARGSCRRRARQGAVAQVARYAGFPSRGLHAARQLRAVGRNGALRWAEVVGGRSPGTLDGVGARAATRGVGSVGRVPLRFAGRSRSRSRRRRTSRVPLIRRRFGLPGRSAAGAWTGPRRGGQARSRWLVWSRCRTCLRGAPPAVGSETAAALASDAAMSWCARIWARSTIGRMG